jgi:hypothetical protein
MKYLLRMIGLALLLPAVASCPRPASPINNPLVPGAPPAQDARTFRAQLRTYLSNGGPDAPSAKDTKGLFVAAMAYGNGVQGVTMNPQAVTCGNAGCFMEVRYSDQVAVHTFDLRMLGAESPFIKWGWGEGRTVPEAVRGGLSATWYFNTPNRN